MTSRLRSPTHCPRLYHSYTRHSNNPHSNTMTINHWSKTTFPNVCNYTTDTTTTIECNQRRVRRFVSDEHPYQKIGLIMRRPFSLLTRFFLGIVFLMTRTCTIVSLNNTHLTPTVQKNQTHSKTNKGTELTPTCTTELPKH